MKRVAFCLSIGAALFGSALLGTVAGARMVGGGGGFFSGQAKPQVMYPIRMQLQAHERTHIVVTGDGGDLDCYLYEGDFKQANGDTHLLVRDDSNRDGCNLTVVPARTGTHLLLVQNQSSHIERYVVSVD